MTFGSRRKDASQKQGRVAKSSRRKSRRQDSNGQGSRSGVPRPTPSRSINVRSTTARPTPSRSINVRSTTARPTPSRSTASSFTSSRPVTSRPIPSRSAGLRRNNSQHEGPKRSTSRSVTSRPISSRSAASSSASSRSATARSGSRPATSRSAASRSRSSQHQDPYRENIRLTSVRLGDIERRDRNERIRQRYRHYVVRIGIVLALIVACTIGWAILYNSNAFTIENVSVSGVEHLTSNDMTQLINVPEGTTLLRVDTDTIRNRLLKNAWVKDVEVVRVWPHTLQINVTERVIAAVVEVPTADGSAKREWAIASDHMWLMPIPDPASEAGKATSARIYEDAAAALHITDVPYATQATIGEYCTDDNVNNALDIVANMTTDLADQVVTVSAAGPVETTLILDNGVQIAFGAAENVRDKERVILQILEENEGTVSYINVRSVNNPTWRSI